MKKFSILLYIITVIVTVVITRLFVYFTDQKIDLPEEYKLITKDTPIQGYYKDNVLIIEFKH